MTPAHAGQALVTLILIVAGLALYVWLAVLVGTWLHRLDTRNRFLFLLDEHHKRESPPLIRRQAQIPRLELIKAIQSEQTATGADYYAYNLAEQEERELNQNTEPRPAA